jgi:hypothetical protein
MNLVLSKSVWMLSQPVSKRALIALQSLSGRSVGTRLPRPDTLVDIAQSVTTLWLRPRWHAVQKDFSQAPHMVGQSRRHRRRPRLPPLDGCRLGDRIELGQRQAQAGVRQHEVVVHLEHRQLLT